MSLRLKYLKTKEWINVHLDIRFWRNLRGRLVQWIDYKVFYLKQNKLTRIRMQNYENSMFERRARRKLLRESRSRDYNLQGADTTITNNISPTVFNSIKTK